MTYFAKQTRLISHPNLKLISNPLLCGSHHLHDVDWCGKVCTVTYKSGDNQTGMTYKSLVLSHLTYKSDDLLEPNRPLVGEIFELNLINRKGGVKI